MPATTAPNLPSNDFPDWLSVACRLSDDSLTSASVWNDERISEGLRQTMFL